MSYPLAAFVAGYLAERGFDRRYLTSVVAMGAGLAIIFACGVAWMAFGAPHARALDRRPHGLVPFIPPTSSRSWSPPRCCRWRGFSYR
jgi:biotin transport system substrate-specific component